MCSQRLEVDIWMAWPVNHSWGCITKVEVLFMVASCTHTHILSGVDMHTCGCTEACRETCSHVWQKKLHISLICLFSLKHLLIGISTPYTQNNMPTYILDTVSQGITSHQSLLSSVPPHCHHPIINSWSHESTNQHRPGAVQILLPSC